MTDERLGPIGRAAPAEADAPLARFLQVLFEFSGVDFRDYAYSSLRRRIAHALANEKLADLPSLEKRVRSDPAALDRLLSSLTVHVTAMFRDPEFYRVVRQHLVPAWQTYPFVRLWVAGCSSGEEVYSLAILLHEEGLYSRCRIYATDLSEVMLARAKSGVFPLSVMRDYTQAYHAAGGRAQFSDYYTGDESSIIFRAHLRENLIFAPHNLVGDTSFNEFHGIFCRNVMIYFNAALQNRVHQLFYESLIPFGYLALGRSETLRSSPEEKNFQEVSAKERLFRKIR